MIRDDDIVWYTMWLQAVICYDTLLLGLVVDIKTIMNPSINNIVNVNIIIISIETDDFTL